MGYGIIVESRFATVLISIINSVVKAGGIIPYDEWKAYKNLSNSVDYEYYTVCHKYNFFVDPITGVHTQA